MPMTTDPPCVRAFRDELAQRIIQEAQRLFPEAISFHHKTAVTKVDFKRQLVHLSRDGSNTTQVCTLIMLYHFNSRWHSVHGSIVVANLRSVQAASLKSPLLLTYLTQPQHKSSLLPSSYLTCGGPVTVLSVSKVHTTTMSYVQLNGCNLQNPFARTWHCILTAAAPAKANIIIPCCLSSRHLSSML